MLRSRRVSSVLSQRNTHPTLVDGSTCVSSTIFGDGVGGFGFGTFLTLRYTALTSSLILSSVSPEPLPFEIVIGRGGSTLDSSRSLSSSSSFLSSDAFLIARTCFG